MISRCWRHERVTRALKSRMIEGLGGSARADRGASVSFDEEFRLPIGAFA